jgi:hypothetical protein
MQCAREGLHCPEVSNPQIALPVQPAPETHRRSGDVALWWRKAVQGFDCGSPELSR